MKRLTVLLSGFLILLSSSVLFGRIPKFEDEVKHTCVASCKGYVWIGTSEGILYVNDVSWDQQPHRESGKRRFIEFGTDMYITSIHPIKYPIESTEAIIGLNKGGIRRCKLREDDVLVIDRYRNNSAFISEIGDTISFSSYFPDLNISCITKRDDSTFYAGVFSGILSFSRENYHFSNSSPDLTGINFYRYLGAITGIDSDIFNGYPVSCIQRDNGELIIANYKGFYHSNTPSSSVFSIKNDTIITVYGKEIEDRPLKIVQDSEKIYLIAEHDIYEVQEGIEPIKLNIPLNNSIIRDGVIYQGTFYLATTKGAMEINNNTITYRFSNINGEITYMQGISFDAVGTDEYGNVFFCDSDGNLHAPYIRGYSTFNVVTPTDADYFVRDTASITLYAFGQTPILNSFYPRIENKTYFQVIESFNVVGLSNSSSISYRTQRIFKIENNEKSSFDLMGRKITKNPPQIYIDSGRLLNAATAR